MALDRNSPVFAHHNGQLRIIALEGPTPGRGLKLDAAESVKMDPGNKVKSIPGAFSGPIAVVSSGADPSFEFKLSTQLESVQILKLIGNVHQRFTLVRTYTRPGLKRITYRSKNCMIEKGLGVDSSHDNGVQDTVSGKCTDITVQEEGGREMSVVSADPDAVGA